MNNTVCMPSKMFPQTANSETSHLKKTSSSQNCLLFSVFSTQTKYSLKVQGSERCLNCAPGFLKTQYTRAGFPNWWPANQIWPAGGFQRFFFCIDLFDLFYIKDWKNTSK